MAVSGPRDNLRSILRFQGRRNDWVGEVIGLRDSAAVARKIAGRLRWREREARLLALATGVTLDLLFPDPRRILPDDDLPYGRRATDVVEEVE